MDEEHAKCAEFQLTNFKCILHIVDSLVEHLVNCVLCGIPILIKLLVCVVDSES